MNLNSIITHHTASDIQKQSICWKQGYHLYTLGIILVIHQLTTEIYAKVTQSNLSVTISKSNDLNNDIHKDLNKIEKYQSMSDNYPYYLKNKKK